jgi:hypothetical protein
MIYYFELDLCCRYFRGASTIRSLRPYEELLQLFYSHYRFTTFDFAPRFAIMEMFHCRTSSLIEAPADSTHDKLARI